MGLLKSEKKKLERMKGSVSRTPFCCGLHELGSFKEGHNNGSYSYRKTLDFKEMKRAGYAMIATTRRGLDADVALGLKLRKFKKVGKWKNPNTGRWLTLWAWFPT